MKKILYLLSLVLMITGFTYSQTTRLDGNNEIDGTALAADSVWGGNYTDLIDKDISTISIFVWSDSASASSGLKIYYSPDGVTARDSVSYSIVADSSVSLTLTPTTRYYKLGYTNGSKASGTTWIKAILRTIAKGF